MKTMQQTWKRFLATMALASAINSNSDAVSAADSTQPAGTSATASARSVGRGTVSKAPPVRTSQHRRRACFGVDPRLRQRYGINPCPALRRPTPAPTVQSTRIGRKVISHWTASSSRGVL